MPQPVRYAIEEELYATEPLRPSLQSLYYLARLLWQDPGFYYSHTASNFARGEDLRQGLMSGIEISTRPCIDLDALVAELAARRAALAGVCDALLVPVGHLFDYRAPTNTCGLHVHIGPVADLPRVYDNLAYFLPLLALMSANSPYADGQAAGLSYRIAHSYAIGPITTNPFHRFSDLIISKRLGTIEIRILDPFWDLERLAMLLRVLDAIVADTRHRQLDRSRYRRLRRELTDVGYGTALQQLYRELSGLIDIEERWFREPPALASAALAAEYGILGAYSAIDSAYRGGALRPGALPAGSKQWERTSRAALGLAGYYVLRLPYTLRKVLVER